VGLRAGLEFSEERIFTNICRHFVKTGQQQQTVRTFVISRRDWFSELRRIVWYELRLKVEHV
jgi:hypothetical protein